MEKLRIGIQIGFKNPTFARSGRTWGTQSRIKIGFNYSAALGPPPKSRTAPLDFQGLAGGPSLGIAFMISAHRESITLLDVPSEYHEGAPCSTCAAGERGVLHPNAQTPQTLGR